MIDLPDSFFDFVSENAGADIPALTLKQGGKALPFPFEFALVQIAARCKTSSKLGTFLSEPRFIFPTLLSAEQASDSRVARTHAEKVKGKRVLDLTAGLGIDAMSMACVATVTAVEMESLKCDALRHNAALFSLDLNVINDTAENVISSLSDNTFDTIFIDPARRDGAGHKVHAFADCSPDVVRLLPAMLKIAPEIIIKASPLLDISAIAESLPGISEIGVVSVRGEVKELTVCVARTAPSSPYVTVKMIDADENSITLTFDFHRLGHDGVIPASDDDICHGAYLYEPDAAIMKCAPWGELCRLHEGLKKVSHDTNLFVSTRHIPDFPGRCVQIEAILDKRSSRLLKGSTANVCVRNYPIGAEALHKKLGVKDGGDTFIYGFRSPSGRPTLLTTIRRVSE